jgi:hypothetical protein
VDWCWIPTWWIVGYGVSNTGDITFEHKLIVFYIVASWLCLQYGVIYLFITTIYTTNWLSVLITFVPFGDVFRYQSAIIWPYLCRSTHLMR